MKKMMLTKEEQKIENAIVRGEYRTVSRLEYERIAQAIARRKKDAVLNIRVNSKDLKNIKQKASKFGVPYQTFISELLHHFAA